MIELKSPKRNVRRSGPRSKVLIALLLVMMVACSDVVDLKIRGVEEQLVIYGRITDGIAGNEVDLALTSPINGNQEPVPGASVMLFEEGIHVADYVEHEPGNYRLFWSGDSAREGRSYQLRVILRGGEEYHSTPAIMPRAAAVDEVSYEAALSGEVVNQAGVTIEKRLLSLYADTRIIDPEEDSYLRWNILESYSVQERIRPSTGMPPPPCYVIKDVTGQELRLFNGAEIKVPVIPDQLLYTTEIDSRFAFRMFYRVVLSTMDQEAYEYWSLVDEIANVQGSIFDKPAAPIPGNMTRLDNPKEEVLGYFEVIRSDTSFVSMREDDLDFLIFHPCPHWNIALEPAWCTGCLLLDNSTHDRPYYWDY